MSAPACTVAWGPTHRRREWQTALAACMAERAHRPFEWGVQDCALYAADCVHAVTGVDPAADLRGTYASAWEAQHVLEQHGGLPGLAIARLGPVIPVAQAQAGDVGLTRQDDRYTLAVYGGAQWFAPAAQGVVALRPEAVQRAWRCCRG